MRAEASYFQFPAWVEICRAKTGIAIPADLQAAYFDALRQLPALIAAAASRHWDADFLACALAALAASKGHVSIAEAVLELNPATADEFLAWSADR